MVFTASEIEENSIANQKEVGECGAKTDKNSKENAKQKKVLEKAVGKRTLRPRKETNANNDAKPNNKRKSSPKANKRTAKRIKSTQITSFFDSTHHDNQFDSSSSTHLFNSDSAALVPANQNSMFDLNPSTINPFNSPHSNVSLMNATARLNKIETTCLK